MKLNPTPMTRNDDGLSVKAGTLTDELTNLLNRRGFMLQMQRVLAAARCYGEAGVVIYCDLDHFKAVNDSLGHACGDEVLRSVSRVLVAAVRSIDVAGRLGGDEFALCLVQTTLKDGLKRAAGLQWLLDHTQIDWHGATITLGATLGIEPYGPNDAVNDLILRADMAMYYNKRRKYQNAMPLAAE